MTSQLSTDRTQSNAWFFEARHPPLLRLSRHLDHVSALQVSFEGPTETYDRFLESEDYQVGGNGPG